MTSGALATTHAHPGRAQVRGATEADIPDLLTLWGELQRSGGRHVREALHLAFDDIALRFSEAMCNADCRVVVATCGDDVCGMAVLTQTSLGPLSSLRAVQLHHLVVASGHRRAGVGHALLAFATSYADEVGAEHILVGVSPGLRDTNRFYARLGFSPVLVRRMSTVSSLRRRLADSEHPVAALEELTRKRLIARPRLSLAARRAGSRR